MTSSSSFVSKCKYDVFLSFRGEDTRNNFTDHLYAALKRRGIVTFKDDRNLEAGEEIAQELLKAIQESWCSVIVFSKTYTFSSWCLEELAAIVQQKNKREHKIFPIFYDVDPSDLRKQTGKIEEAFSKHEERFKENKEKIQMWRTALTEVANIIGYHLGNKPESEFIEEIVDKICSVVPYKLIGYIFASKDFMPFKSSSFTFNQIINALNTNGVNMVGLHGMPGVGKTTLAKEVVKQVKEHKLFDNVVMVTMSQTPDINNMQDRIAESLHFKFDQAKTEEGKAEELWRKLKGLNNILIIIDDVWNEFELQTIGIPFGVDHEGCKILLTMRLEKVCIQMNCQKKFQLHVLSKDEAWDLFKVKANLKDVSSTLNYVAEEVASECKGLPLAIAVVGKALKGESLDGWIAANKRFKDSRHSDNEDVCGGVYSSLRLSYDYLKTDNIRSCFLLCSLFPEDCRIDIELLIRFAIGQGLFSDIDLLNDLRREICEAVKKLHDSGLLLKTDGGVDDDDDDDDDVVLNVKMHDVVRDFAHWITSKGENMFMVKERLEKWPIRTRFECYTAICIWENMTKNFPENLAFPKLKILHFQNSAFQRFIDVRVPSAFVEGMKALQVLHLKDVTFSLEVSKFLRNLRSLWFVNCKLENILLLTNMENLEILALIGTNIFKLPEELLALHRLKSLHLSCNGVIKFPPNLLSRLTSLQELHLLCKNDVNLLELNSLPHLTVLSLHVSAYYQLFPKNFVFPKLERYFICVNADRIRTTPRSLRISKFSSSLRAFKELFCNVKHVIIQDCPKLIVVFQINEVLQRGQIYHSIPLLSNLTSLQLQSLPELQSIWKLQPIHQEYHISLRSLKDIRIIGCHKLKSIFSSCVAHSLLHLQQLIIRKCDGLEQVFDYPQKLGELEHIPSLLNLPRLDLEFLPKLRCIWKGPTHLVKLQSLTVLTITGCAELAYLFPSLLTQSLVNLEILEVKNCKSLEHVIIEEAAENEDRIDLKLQHRRRDIVLQRLQILKLENLENLSSFCPENFVMSLSLKEFKVRNCPRLTRFGNWQGVALKAEFENVPLYDSKGLLCNAKKLTMDRVKYHKNLVPNVHPEGLNEITFLRLEHGKGLECLIDTTHQGHVSAGAFFNLVELHIEKVTGLKMLCNGPFPKGFLQKLENLVIWDCEEIVSLPLVLQNPKKVRIINCGQLQQVFQTEELLHDIKENKAPLLSNLTSLELQRLPELKWTWKGPCHYVCLQSLKVAKFIGCKKLKYLFSQSLAQSLVLLEELFIANCDELEHIITTEPEGGHVHLTKLTSLKVDRCPRLEYIFKIDLDEGLPHLKSLSIIHAFELKQVFINVAKQENAVGHAFVLPCLQHLQLENLINLSCFCTENYPIVSPCLEILKVKACPALENFAIQQVNQKAELKELELSRLENDIVYDVINCQKIFQIKVEHLLSMTEIIKLVSIHQLQGPIQVASFQYLKQLTVLNCSRLKYLFSSVLVQNLPRLKILKIKYCVELEEIIEMDKTSITSSSQGHLQPIFFPSLEDLWIDGCSNLKSLFPISVIPSLSNLRSLVIQGVSKLEQVFGYQVEPDIQDDQKEIVLPELKEFRLHELPNLKSFALMGYCFQFPYFRHLKVTKCPKLITRFRIDAKNSVHPITKKLKAPQLVQITMEEIVDNQSTCNDFDWNWNYLTGFTYMTMGETKIMIGRK